MDRDQSIPDDLEDRLRAARLQLTPLELDQLKRTVLTRASAPSTARKAGFLKSRLALTFVLVTGLLMSGTGATLAVTGIAGQGDASVSQYAPAGQKGDQGGVQGEQESGSNTGDTESGDNGSGDNGSGDTESGDNGNVLGDQDSGGDGTSSRAGDQVAASSTDPRLPFTGFVVFPLLIGGIALLGGGLLLRRRSVLS